MKQLWSFLLLLGSIHASAQADIEQLSDEFSDEASLVQWKRFHDVEGFPDKIGLLAVKEGKLKLQPKASGWYADNQAPFLFKTLTGNFDVRARLKVSGKGTELPTIDWSLAGLMVRQPKRTDRNSWQPRQENWLFITTGVAEQTNLPVFEVKTTNNSLSNLKLRPAKAGWVELRIVRLEAAFVLMARYEGQRWQILERFYRPVMMGPLQVGLNAYSCWNAIPPSMKTDPKIFNERVVDTPADLQLEVDYIRFKRPRIDLTQVPGYQPAFGQVLFYTPANLLTDYAISNETILAMVGD
ncbi:hypothetical protein [Paraflavitalea pollutisoli]|uniref:hypothetical protein n=1 Tax=Paraflavitalea pollutisoli TaxID=3034143 RepID=UPI0023EE0540|nr:hypothetical protein [Paraflavitalea sp. H1-2-19X]